MNNINMPTHNQNSNTSNNLYDNLYDLQTPVEQYGNIYLKRQDLYEPYEDIRLTGSKVAQCRSLIKSKLTYIREKCNNTVITATSGHSPQGLIVSRVAAEFGCKCKLVLGGTSEKNAMRHKFIEKAVKYNAELDTECAIGYNSAMNKRVETLIEQYPMFNIGFGMNIHTSDNVLIETVARDVYNLPDNIQTLVIPVGSGITAGAILYGLEHYAPAGHKPKKIICIQIANYDRTDIIKSISPTSNFTFIKHNKYPYSRLIKLRYYGINLDPRYEAKAFEWLLDNREELGDVLFWIIGTTSYLL